jgi:3-oxoacyl-[acyl-carrier protein] reductase
VAAIDLSGKVALVTGSSRGIGKAVAAALARRGATVVVNCQRSRAELEATAATLAAEGLNVYPVVADVAEEEAVERLFAEIRERFGMLHYLVNNAGRAIDRPFHQMTVAEFRAVLESHALSTFLCARAAAALMPSGGAILNIGAASANTGRRNGVNYCAAKAAVMAMTKCLAMELAPEIRVHCLVPGWTETEDVVRRFDLAEGEQRRRLEAGILLGRLAQPSEIATWAVYLLTQAPYTTGQLFYVNGGSYLG